MQSKKTQDDFSTIIDSLADEALNAPAEEIAELYVSANLDPSRGSDRIANILTETINAYRRRKLGAARVGYDQLSDRLSTRAHAIPADIKEQRNLLKSICAKSGQAQALTMRFRDGKDMSDSDVTSILEDLQTLGVLEDL